MPQRIRRVLLAVIGASIFLAGPVLAKPKGKPGGKTVALPLFRQGIKLYDEGYYQEAIEKYKLAYFHFPSAKIHTRIGQAYIFLGQPLKAIHHYEEFIKVFKPASDADKKLLKASHKQLRKLFRRISQLELAMQKPVGAEIRVNGRLVGKAPLRRKIRLMPGSVNVSAALKGFYGFRKDLDLKIRTTTALKITLIKIKPKVIRKVVKIKATPIYKRWWFWTAIGALVAGGAAAGIAVPLTQPRKRDLTGVGISHDGLPLRW